MKKEYGALFKKIWDAELEAEKAIGRVTERPVIHINLPVDVPQCFMCGYPLDEKGCINIHCRNELFRKSIAKASGGLYLEFGVAWGETINQIALLAPDQLIYGFDSWEGLPEAWKDGFEKGSFKCKIPKVPGNVKLIAGLFKDTLTDFLDSHHAMHIAFIHMDADIYSSTKYVLKTLAGNEKIDNTVIQFDEYDNPGDSDEEHAFEEIIKEYNLKYTIIGFCPKPHRQVSFLVTRCRG